MGLRKIDVVWEHDYYFCFTMQMQEEGLWHVDPDSLLDYKIVDEE